MIADMINNKKLNLIVTKLFIRSRKLIFPLFLLHHQILKHQKKFHETLHIFYREDSK